MEPPHASHSPNGVKMRVGTSSWADRSLTQDSNWYPKKSMKAAERIEFYSDRFSLVEMENTHRFPPTRAICEQWVERTPKDFRFNIPVWTLLSGRATFPPSLYEDLWSEIREEKKDNPRLYASHLPGAVIDECWSRFVDALRPLAQNNRLGTVVLRLPGWMQPGSTATKLLQNAREKLSAFQVAIEVGHRAWFTPDNCESTFDMFEDFDFSFVCLDAPIDHPLSQSEAWATTNGLGMVRLIGRRAYEDREGWSDDYRSYRYTEAEVDEVAKRIEHLALGCDELHVVVSTCWKDDAVSNAQLLVERLDCAGAIDLRSIGIGSDERATHDEPNATTDNAVQMTLETK